jgi:hypothetical protein
MQIQEASMNAKLAVYQRRECVHVEAVRGQEIPRLFDRDAWRSRRSDRRDGDRWRNDRYRGYDSYRGPMKHRGLDRNGDGVITRREWRGNDRSFENMDRNHDGILSGWELTPGRGRWR